MSDTILVINAGSSSIKFQLFEVDADDQLQRRLKGQIEGIGVKPRLAAKDAKGEILVDQTWTPAEAADVPAALGKVVEFLRAENRNLADCGWPPRGAWRSGLQRADPHRRYCCQTA